MLVPPRLRRGGARARASWPLGATALRIPASRRLRNAARLANVDLVRRRFRPHGSSRRPRPQTVRAETWDATPRATFAHGELPPAPRSLADLGKLQRRPRLFRPDRGTGAIGQFNELLGKYFDGDGSRLAQLLDPTREASPLYQFRNEVSGEFRSLGERIAALEAASRARADERVARHGQGPRVRGRGRGRPGRAGAWRRRLPRADRDRGRRRPAVQEGRLRPDRRPQPDQRSRAAGRDRGQGPTR